MDIYLDNAATTQVDPKVEEVMEKYFFELYGNPSSKHHIGFEVNDALQRARRVIADKIGANPV